MKVFSIVVLFFLIVSCEKSTDPLGESTVYLETDKPFYSTDDTIKIYLVNNSVRSVYSHPPGDVLIMKEMGDRWEKVYPEYVITVVLPPREWKNNQELVRNQRYQDIGVFRIQMYLSWDPDGKLIEGLGMVFSNTFRISGT